MTDIKGFTRVRDLLWPAYDKECARAVFSTFGDALLAVDRCVGRRVVVQAGGNCGVWALELSKLFETVYTFEPDLMNFTALVVNTAEVPNIVKMQAALGDKAQFVSMKYDEPENCGCGRIVQGGIVPTLRIDDLKLEWCDLICLDVEGRELAALVGASNTIRKCKPAILFEDKGLSSHYGVMQGAVANWLEETHDYRIVHKVRRDFIMVPFDRAEIKPDVFKLMNLRGPGETVDLG